MDRPPSWLRRKKKTITWLGCAFLAIYVGSYYALSRSSVHRLKGTGIEGFYYVPCRAESLRSTSVQTVHHVLTIIYSPVWAIDHYVFGGPLVAGIPMFELSEEAE